MAVKRNSMAQALTKLQTVQRASLTVPPVATNAQGVTVQRVNPVAGTSYSDATNRLRSGQEITESAIQGRGFDPRGGIGVAVAQIATAGIGAWAQNTARKELAEIEINRQNKLSSLLTSKGYTPESASAIASMTTPESGSSIIGSFISQDMAKNDPATQLNLQKTQAEINKLNAETGKTRSEARSGGSGSAPSGYRFQQDGSLEAIPGGPAGKLSAESAGKIALVKQGEMDVKRFSDLITVKDEKGNIAGYDRKKIAGLNTYFAPGARKERSTLYNAINAKLRIESGAAVPKAEVKAAMETFRPSTLDSDATIKSKLDRLDEFFGIAKQEIGQGRGATPTQATIGGETPMPQKTGFQILNVRDK